MIKSMTGFGVAEGMMNDSAVRVEVKSVNSRYFDFNCRMPSKLSFLEVDIKKLVNKTVSRGKVMLNISIDSGRSVSSVELNEEKVLFYLKKLRAFSKKHKIEDDLKISDFLRFPDVFVEKEKPKSSAALKKDVFPFIEKAVAGLCVMREKEGLNIEKDFRKRLKVIQSKVKMIERAAKKEPTRFKKRLEDHLKNIDKKLQYNPERLEQEVAYLADKADITEEIVRIDSHCSAFIGIIEKGGEAGKKLDFLAQELNREANTIASKSQNAAITQNAVAIKLEIEKIREQVQNIE